MKKSILFNGRIIRKLLTITALLCLSGIANAGDGEKIAIAIMEFRANDTKESVSLACADILSEKLFSSKLFTMMEKSQMDKIARAHGYTEFNSVDPEQAAKLGRLLKVEKVIVGSVTFLESYIIKVKSISVTTGEIDIDVTRKIKSLGSLESALADIALYIERHYSGYYHLSGNFDIAAEMIVLLPVGILSREVDIGIGAQGLITLNSPFQMPFNLQFVAGFYTYYPGPKSIKYFNMESIYLCASSRFSLARNIKFCPSVGAGFIFSQISADDRENNAIGTHIYTKHYYYNPCTVIRAELDIFLFDRWNLVFIPQYTAFFELPKVGQILGLGLGVKMLF